MQMISLQFQFCRRGGRQEDCRLQSSLKNTCGGFLFLLFCCFFYYQQRPAISYDQERVERAESKDPVVMPGMAAIQPGL